MLLLLLLESEGAGEGVEGGVEMVLSSSSSSFSPRMLWIEKDFFLEDGGLLEGEGGVGGVGGVGGAVVE